MFIAHASPGQAFAAILSGIRGMLALRANAIRPITAPAIRVLMLVYWRLARMAGRLDRLVACRQAGTLPRPRPSRAGRPRHEPAASFDRPPPPSCPRGHAWLIGLHQPTAQYAGQVQAFIDNPDTRALVEAAPQAGRLLRPLCRMLGLAPPPWLRLPERPGPPRPMRPPPAAQAPPVPPVASDRPLPREVRAAVRAWRSTPR